MNDLFFVEGTIDEPEVQRSGLESFRPFEGNFGATEALCLRHPPQKDVLGAIPTRPNSSNRAVSRLDILVVHPEYLSPSDTTIPPFIRHQLRGFEFYWVQLACTFSPGRGHTFESARFQITLITEAADPTSTIYLSSPAMAYSLYPDRIEDEYAVTRKISVTPELKLAAFPIEIPLGYERTMSGATYKVRVESFGLQETLAGWIFTRNASHALSGTNSLFLLLRKPRTYTGQGDF